MEFAIPDGVVQPINLESHVFTTPVKEIHLPEDIQKKWEISEAYHNLLDFICTLSVAVRSRKISDPCYISPITSQVLIIIETLSAYVDEIPLETQPQRFGNKAFRIWFCKLQENVVGLLKNALGEIYWPSICELSVYLVESVGNQTRIDYGTGHELSFLAFLFCLFKIGALKMPQDSVAAVVLIFTNYLELMRKVQKTYNLEPAGSQGVWNLDDFQFIPFIWGSSQLIDNPVLKPKSYLDEDICRTYSKDYLFLSCVSYINKVKTGPFAEHSNQLWNISAVPNWNKVNSGLIKMYRVEVLSKFPIIQHFLFGSLLRTNPLLKK